MERLSLLLSFFKMNYDEMVERLDAGEDPLEVSILKWKDIVEGKGTNEYDDNCALCHVYLTSDMDCGDCPILVRTGKNCSQLSYMDFVNHVDTCPICTPERYCPVAINLAEGELRFLESLRKPKQK